MSKVITSPVKKWSGTVTISDPLSLPQAVKFQQAIRDAAALMRKALVEAGIDVKLEKAKKTDFDKVRLSTLQVNEVYGEAILDCVEEWNLEGIENPPEYLPGTPGISAGKLSSWLIKEITALFKEDEEVPNE